MKSFTTSKPVPAYCFVKFTDDKTIEPATSGEDNIFAVSDTVNTEKDDICDVYTNGQICQIQAGGAFNAGDRLTADENGYAVKAQAGDNVGAIAYSASSGEGQIVYAVVALGGIIPPAVNNEQEPETTTNTSGT